MWCETYNHVYGRTNNPYDLGRGCGGSSGGEGAIVAAGASPFGLGADVGGSIRYPSAFCGVPGHKPTGRLVPGTGHWPEAHGVLANYCTYGPMCRSVDDLAYILPILTGPDGKDKVTIDHEIKNMDEVDVSKLNVYFFDYNGQAACGRDVRRAVNMAAGALSAVCNKSEYWLPDGFENSLEIWQAGMAQNPEPLKESLGDGKPLPLAKEVLRFLAGKSKCTLPVLSAAVIEAPGQLLKGHNQKFIDLSDQMRKEIEDRLGNDGVIICPVFGQPAPKHSRIWFDLFGIGYSGAINILQFPATVFPVFHGKDGVPVSIQIISSRFNDHLTLAVAKKLEEVFGGWKLANPS